MARCPNRMRLRFTMNFTRPNKQVKSEWKTTELKPSWHLLSNHSARIYESLMTFARFFIRCFFKIRSNKKRKTNKIIIYYKRETLNSVYCNVFRPLILHFILHFFRINWDKWHFSIGRPQIVITLFKCPVTMSWSCFRSDHTIRQLKSHVHWLNHKCPLASNKHEKNNNDFGRIPYHKHY